MLRSLILLIILINNSSYANATSVARGIGNENRIKIINYKPNTVFRFTGHYTYQSIIEFALDEEIDTISMGTPTPWQIIPAGNRIFLKPVEDDATTNMTVITNKRMYFFEMHAEEATDIDDDNLSFVVKFVYPDDGIYSSFTKTNNNSGASQAIRTASSYSGPDLSRPELYNFNYKISGKKSDIEPLQIFDDGEFTYFKFRNINAEIPAIFLVDSENREGIINYRVAGGYIVVERVAAKFTLRHGKNTICVFNESYNNINY